MVEDQDQTCPGRPDRQLYDAVGFPFGFWLVVCGLALLGFGNVWVSVPKRVPGREPLVPVGD